LLLTINSFREHIFLPCVTQDPAITTEAAP
jgi:hypothetical protein